MFKFLKDKLKKSVDVFSKKVDEEAEVVEETIEEEKPEEVKEEIKEEISNEVEESPSRDEDSEDEIKEEEDESFEEEVSPEDLKEDIEKEDESAQEIIDSLTKERPVQEEFIDEVDELKEDVVDVDELIKEDSKNKKSDEIKEESRDEISAQDVIDDTFEKDARDEVKGDGSTDIDKLVKESVSEELKDGVKEEDPIGVSKVEEGENLKKSVDIEKEEKTGFFGKLVSKKLSEDKFEELFWDLEIMLLENNVSVKVIEKIKDDLKKVLIDKSFKKSKLLEIIHSTLKNSIKEILSFDKVNLLNKIKEKKPYVICFLGINGSGKTTTIAKITNLLLKNDKKVVLAAADTFRAAAIDQLQEHADKLDVKLIKHDYGSDPAAVAFDAIKYAESKDIDVVLIDTAGRMHSNVNLQEEMKKIIRISNPDFKIFVGESITGNDCVEQAQQFNESAGIDGIVLSKADIDEKGGASISISYVVEKPILYLGMGQEYGDLEEFDVSKMLEKLDL